MGIEHLLKNVTLEQRNINTLITDDDVIGIDISCCILFLYLNKFLGLHKAKHIYLIDLVKNPKSTIYLAYFKWFFLKLANFKVLVVFDGNTIPLKMNTVIKRNQNSVYSVKNMYWPLKEFLEKHEISYCQALNEADTLLVEYYYKNKIQYILTEDSDYIIYGIDRLLLKFKPVSQLCSVYFKDNNLFLKNLSSNELVNLGIISGCDYFKLSGVGFKTALKILKRHQTLENFIKITLNPEQFDLFSKVKYHFMQNIN